jgi:Zn-dependent M28 family amino/carboxypeptidase
VNGKRRLVWLLDSLVSSWNLLRMPGRSYRGPLPPPDDDLRNVTAELRRHIVHLADEIGERNIQSRPRELALAAEYIRGEFADSGFTCTEHAYQIGEANCRNLAVEIPGSTRADEIVVIGAHYDSVVGSPAANDNGSGIAAMLSLAGHCSAQRYQRTLRFVAFVNEEKPYGHTRDMGSWVYARQCRQRSERITAMLTLETIGYYSDERGSQKYPPFLGLLYPSQGNFIGFIGNTRYGKLLRQVVGAFRRAERFPSQGAVLPDFISDIARSDHWSFWQEGYPALMVTDTANFRYPYYHTAEDTPDKVDFERTARVVRGLRGVIASLCS